MWVNTPFQNSASRSDSDTKKTTNSRSYVPIDNAIMFL